MMQKMERVIPEKHDHRPIAVRSQIKRIGKEVRDGVVARQERHENELDDVEEDVDGEEGADPDVEAIAEF